MNPIYNKSFVSRQFDLVGIATFEDAFPNHESRSKNFSNSLYVNLGTLESFSHFFQFFNSHEVS